MGCLDDPELADARPCLAEVEEDSLAAGDLFAEFDDVDATLCTVPGLGGPVGRDKRPTSGDEALSPVGLQRAGRPHCHPVGGQVGFGLRHGVLAVMKDGRRQHGVCAGFNGCIQ
jgi:hypothetical protein